MPYVFATKSAVWFIVHPHCRHARRWRPVSAREFQHAHEHAGPGIEGSGLDQDVACVEARQLWTCDREMIAIDDRECSLWGNERCDSPQGRLLRRPRSQHPTVPRDGCAGDQVGETL